MKIPTGRLVVPNVLGDYLLKQFPTLVGKK